jgi:hypothetical protein
VPGLRSGLAGATVIEPRDGVDAERAQRVK